MDRGGSVDGFGGEGGWQTGATLGNDAGKTVGLGIPGDLFGTAAEAAEGGSRAENFSDGFGSALAPGITTCSDGGRMRDRGVVVKDLSILHALFCP